MKIKRLLIGTSLALMLIASQVACFARPTPMKLLAIPHEGIQYEELYYKEDDHWMGPSETDIRRYTNLGERELSACIPLNERGKKGIQKFRENLGVFQDDQALLKRSIELDLERLEQAPDCVHYYERARQNSYLLFVYSPSLKLGYYWKYVY